MSESALRGGRFRACLTRSVWLLLMPPAHTEDHTVPVVISVMFRLLLDHYNPGLTTKHLGEVLHTTDGGIQMPFAWGTHPHAVRLAGAQR